MTFYLRSYPFTPDWQRPRRATRRWIDTGRQSLNVNVHEQDDSYILSALVPGLSADDLNIQVLDDVVRLEGQYRQDENQFLMQELPHGSFTRTLRMPVPIEANKVEAKIEDGILTLTLPKSESAKPKRISIKSR